MQKEALLYHSLPKGLIRCDLCAHRCTVKPDRFGICAVRQNVGGTLYSLVYGQAIAVHVDPIEKKPLFNFLPGTRSFSIATVGCNFRCTFCQNADISQAPREGFSLKAEEFAPQQVVAGAKGYACDSIAYTYTEPTVFFEYAYDTAKLAHKEGIKNVFVTNGYMTAEALDELGDLLDAANVDLKSFSDAFYRCTCGARLQPVLDSIKAMHQRGVWVEVTTLLIPGLNDGDDELTGLAQFIAEVDPEIPWHISRFTPRYKMRERPATPLERIHRAAEIGREIGLRYVYVGNVPGDLHENTLCPSCGAVAIGRIGYHTVLNLEGNRCGSCGQELAVVRS